MKRAHDLSRIHVNIFLASYIEFINVKIKNNEMKKTLLIALAVFFTIACVIGQNTDRPYTNNCTNASVSHWSIGVKAGTNYFRVSPSSLRRPYLDRLHFIVGGTVEYSINPLAGIGIELLNNPYGEDISSTSSLEGNTFDVLPYFSVNLSNLLSPYRDGFWRKVNIYLETGAGIGFYHYSLDNAPTTYNRTALVKSGINAEYNLNKFVALALEGQYRYYDKANMGGQNIAKGNCEAEILTLGLRFKLGAETKQHARNISMCEYNPQPIPVADPNAAENLKDALANVESLEQANASLSQKLQNIGDQLENLAAENIVETPEKVVFSFKNIEFEFDSSKLTQASLSILDNIADMLKNASWASLKVFGNADSTGPARYNQILSEKRANIVKGYLVNKDIPASKITTIGNGEDKPIATNSTPQGRQKNRRVDFEIVK